MVGDLVSPPILPVPVQEASQSSRPSAQPVRPLLPGYSDGLLALEGQLQSAELLASRPVSGILLVPGSGGLSWVRIGKQEATGLGSGHG